MHSGDKMEGSGRNLPTVSVHDIMGVHNISEKKAEIIYSFLASTLDLDDYAKLHGLPVVDKRTTKAYVRELKGNCILLQKPKYEFVKSGVEGGSMSQPGMGWVWIPMEKGSLTIPEGSKNQSGYRDEKGSVLSGVSRGGKTSSVYDDLRNSRRGSLGEQKNLSEMEDRRGQGVEGGTMGSGTNRMRKASSMYDDLRRSRKGSVVGETVSFNSFHDAKSGVSQRLQSRRKESESYVDSTAVNKHMTCPKKGVDFNEENGRDFGKQGLGEGYIPYNEVQQNQMANRSQQNIDSVGDGGSQLDSVSMVGSPKTTKHKEEVSIESEAALWKLDRNKMKEDFEQFLDERWVRFEEDMEDRRALFLNGWEKERMQQEEERQEIAKERERLKKEREEIQKGRLLFEEERNQIQMDDRRRGWGNNANNNQGAGCAQMEQWRAPFQQEMNRDLEEYGDRGLVRHERQRRREDDEERIRREAAKALPRIKFYDGKTKWKLFFSQFEKHRIIRQWPDEIAVAMMGLNLEGTALAYYESLDFEGYAELTHKMRERFGGYSNLDIKMEEFCQTRQKKGESIEDWGDRVTEIGREALEGCGEVQTNKQIMRQFLSGCSDREAVLAATGKDFGAINDVIKFIKLYDFRRKNDGNNNNNSSYNLKARKIEVDEDPKLKQMLEDIQEIKINQVKYGQSQSQGGSKTPKCFNCLQWGHDRTECKNEMVCFNCLETGHRRDTCSKTKSNQCNICKKEGHIARNCAQLQCHLCKGPHFKRECPKLNAKGQGNGQGGS